MRRLYSHYTFIYPDLYLKNHIVELDESNRIVNVFAFEKEVEKTEFYSGVLFFIPNDIKVDEIDFRSIKKNIPLYSLISRIKLMQKSSHMIVYDENMNILR